MQLQKAMFKYLRVCSKFLKKRQRGHGKTIFSHKSDGGPLY